MSRKNNTTAIKVVPTIASKEPQIVSIVQEWREVVQSTIKPTSWLCTGFVPSPGMVVAGQQLHFIGEPNIKELKKVATSAPFGKGTETVVDETVRKGLQIDPSLVEFTSPQSWQKRLQGIAAELCNAYNEKEVSLVFYKMLLYEEGGHFAPHKDTLRGKNHIASLLISLPVEGGCEGGVLRVKDVSSNVTMEWDGVCHDLSASWCSFYTDCIHELVPLSGGKRVVLAYEVSIFSNCCRLINIF